MLAFLFLAPMSQERGKIGRIRLARDSGIRTPDIKQAMNQKYKSTAHSHKTVWKLQPLIHRSKRTAASGENSSPRECAEAEYFASVSVWGGLDHRLSEFLDNSNS